MTPPRPALQLVSLLAAAVACRQREAPPVARLASVPAASEPVRVLSYRGLGRQAAVLVGPGPTVGSERLYVSFQYHNVTLEVVAFDPDTGASTTFANPTPSESAARAMVLGPDGNIYFGTGPHARILKLSPRDQTLTELAGPSDTEEMIWDLTFGSDGNLYGVTWPNAKLVQVDPRTGAATDLGRMDASEQYARYVAADDHGFVYIGIGSSRMKVVAYEIASGRHRQLLPDELQTPGFAEVYNAADSNVYARAGSHAFVVQGWQLTPSRNPARRVAKDRTRDGRAVALAEHALVVKDRRGSTARLPFSYRGNALQVFRLAVGPDDELYASTLMPARLLRIDDRAGRVEELGEVGTGEVYNLMAAGAKLLLAGYSTIAPLMTFDPSRPFAPGRNPVPLHVTGEDAGWRPLAMIRGAGDMLYVGAIGGYGKLEGPLCSYDMATGTVELFDALVRDQSISALVAIGHRVIGGTSVTGGSGSHPTQSEALLFEWDPDRRQVTRQIELPGARRVDNLALDEAGVIYAFAGDQLYVVASDSFEIVERRTLPVRKTIWQSVIRDSRGRFWGLATEGVFRLVPERRDVQLVARTANPITGGIALRRDMLYFASGSEIYRYALPTTAP